MGILVVIERSLLVLLDEPKRQREPVNSDGETGGYGCCVKGGGDLYWDWAGDLGGFEVDFLTVPLVWGCDMAYILLVEISHRWVT